jgi:hypothetical protein
MVSRLHENGKGWLRKWQTTKNFQCVCSFKGGNHTPGMLLSISISKAMDSFGTNSSSNPLYQSFKSIRFINSQ